MDYPAVLVKQRSIHTRSLLRSALRGVAVAVALSIVIYFGVSAYAADRLSRPNRLPLNATPAAYRLPYESVQFASAEDNISLAGWYINPSAPQTILVLHGKDSTRDGYPMMDVAQALAHSGYGVFMFDFRGHGQSGGDHYSLGMLEARDVAGAITYLGTRGVAEVGVLGYSMGAATALNSAPDQPALRAIVADSSFADLQPLIDAQMPRAGGLPPLFMPGIELMAQGLYGLDLADNKPVRAVARLGDRPLLFIHGTADADVPLRQAYDLQQAAAGDPNAQLWVVPGAEHIRAYQRDPEEYLLRVRAFFRKYL